MEISNNGRVLPEKYDPLRAMNVRDIKNTDIVILSPTLPSSAVAAGDNTLSSTTTDAYHELFLVSYSVSSSDVDGTGCFVVGSSTYLPRSLELTTPLQSSFTVTAGENAPLLRVPISTTVRLMYVNESGGAGNATGYAVFVKHPLPGYVETE